MRGGGSLSPLLFCCTSLLNSCSDEQFAVPQPRCYDSVILSSSQILRLFVFFSFSRGSAQKQPPILTSKGPAKNSNEKSSISVRQVKGAFSLPTATLPAALYVTSFVDLWRPAAHVAADHNKFRGGVGGGRHPANEMLGNIRYIRSAIAMHPHRAPNPPCIHRLFRQNRFFSPLKFVT